MPFLLRGIIMKKNDIRIKGFKKPKSGCLCCNLEYGQSGILGGLTISKTKKENSEDFIVIDIPFSELNNLKLVIEEIIKRGH
jgi:hypothetical protein